MRRVGFPVLLLLFGAAAHADVPPWAGVYVGPDPKSTAALLPFGGSVWWLDRSAMIVHLAPHDAGFTVAPLGGKLRPPRGGKGGWHLRVGKDDRTQVVDPFFLRILVGFAGTHAFLHVGSDGRPDAGKLVMHDGLVAALDRGAKGCDPVLLRPDPGESHDKTVALAPAQPRPGTIGVRAFLLLELDPEERACADATLPAHAPRVHGLAAGAFVFARPDGSPVAVELVGYMMVEVYVAPELTPPELRQVLRAASEELGRQAE